jgi:hypothetical protein
LFRSKKERGRKIFFTHTGQNDNRNNQGENIGLASKTDVLPNAPRADDVNM